MKFSILNKYLQQCFIGIFSKFFEFDLFLTPFANLKQKLR